MNQNTTTGGAKVAYRASPLIEGTLVRKIISGGQTGVDRGALIAAIELGMEHGGYCPRGRLAEDGVIEGRFELTETESSAYHIRTEKNVVESCGTLIIHCGPLVGGTALTETFARRHRRPCLKIDLKKPQPPVRVETIRAWLRKHRIAVLNVAGPRESSQPGIQEETRHLVLDLATGAFTVRSWRGSLESIASHLKSFARTIRNLSMTRSALLLSTLFLAVFLPLAWADDPVPKGEVTEHTYSQSKIFPGTTRQYWIYVPKQYDPAKPACVHVNQDGIQYNAPAVFDELIAKKEIPVIIGVFVRPGEVKAAGPNALNRFNRSFEYDGLGDAYARFILDEILPEVEKHKTSDGRQVKLSKDGNDRCIAGSSSGAICAFTAAWERPDAFSRVYSTIGTYVGLRGGNVYPTLIRKYEPKPIRIFLQDGSADQNIYGGDWWMANQEMERSLVFAGYEVNHEWGTLGHEGTHGTKIFPDAMRWLWKDWPKSVAAGPGSKQLQDILIPGEGWKLVGEGYGFTEGPVASKDGSVLFNDIPGNKTYAVTADGKATVAIDGSKKANGMAYGSEGRRYVVATETSQILSFGPDDKEPKVVAEGFKGNDIVVRHDGGIYVTNPDPQLPGKVWFITPSGEKKVVDEGLKFPNGVCLSPDQSLLYVAESRTHWVYSYVVQPDGNLAYKQRYFHLHELDTADDAGADGMRTDRDGRLWVATRMGLQVCDQPGRVNCIIPTPNGKCSNVCFGGANFDTVYATCGDKVYSRKVKVKGANHFEAPIKPGNPRL